MLTIKKIYHRRAFRISLFFDFDKELINKAKSIGAHWSKTNKCRHAGEKEILANVIVVK